MKPSRAELDAMMAIMLAAFDPAFGEAWNERQLASALHIPDTRFTLIDAAGIIGPPSPNVPTAGFYLTRKIIDEEELLLIAVAPEYRRTGLASRLIEHLFSAATERGTIRILLEMRADNPALHFYERYGFGQIGYRKDYYKGADGKLRDARTLSVQITQPR